MVSKLKKIINSVLDYCALGLYLYVILSVFLPIFHTGHTEFFGLMALLVKIATLGIAGLKILLSFKDNIRFSLISILALALSFGIYFFKYYTDVNSYLSVGTEIFDLVAVIVALHGISTRRVLRDYIIVRGTCFVIAAVAAHLGIIVSRRDYLPNRPGVWDMGMTHHNMPSVAFLFLALSWIVLIKDSKYRVAHYFVILLIDIYLGVSTTSRTSMLTLGMGVVLLAVIAFIEKSKNGLSKLFISIVSKCALICPILMFVVSIGGAVFRNYYLYCGNTIEKGFFYNMTSRFATLSSDFANHGIKLPWSRGEQTVPYNWILGGDISTAYSDNLVQVLVIKYGIVFTLLFFGFLQYWAIKAYREKNYTDLVIIAVLCIFSVMEHHTVNYIYNPFYCLISTIATDADQYSSRSISKTFRNKKILWFWIAEAVAFVISIVCMMPVFSYQIQSGKLHDYFLVWIVFTVCLIFGAVKIVDFQYNTEEKMQIV